MTRNKILILAALLSLVCAANAQTLSMRQCLSMALENNKEVTKSKTVVEQMNYDVRSYKSNFFPRFNLFATDIYSTAKGSFTIDGGHLPIYILNPATGAYMPNVTVNPDGSYTLNQYADFPSQKMDLKMKNVIVGGVSFTQPLYMGGKISTAYDMSKLGKQMATLGVEMTESEVVAKTYEAYALASKAKEMIQVAKAYKTLLDELQKNVDSAVKHGLKTKNDQLKVQVKQNEASLNLSRAENAYKLAKMNLLHTIGLPLESSIEIEQDEAFVKELEKMLFVRKEIDVEHRTEAQVLNLKTELADKEVRIVQSDYLPNVVLMGGYTYTNGLELAGKKLMDSGQASVAVGVKMPLLTFGERTSKIRSAQAKAQIAQLEQDDLKEKLALDWQQSLNVLGETLQEMELTQTSMAQAEENLQSSRRQYEVGLETLSDYLEAQTLWQQAYANKIDAQYQYSMACIKHMKATGTMQPLLEYINK